MTKIYPMGQRPIDLLVVFKKSPKRYPGAKEWGQISNPPLAGDSTIAIAGRRIIDEGMDELDLDVDGDECKVIRKSVVREKLGLILDD